MEQKHIVIFSHGMGVRKDGRGKFTEIAAALPEIEPVMFDYDTVIDDTTLEISLPSQQPAMLEREIKKARAENPNAIIDIIASSKGCRVVGDLQPEGIRKIILLVPPTEASATRTLDRIRNTPGAVLNIEGISRVPRRDGSTTIIPAQYWKDEAAVKDIISGYNALAEKSEVYIINAAQDDVIGVQNFDGLSKNIHTVTIDGDHSFSGKDRKNLIELVRKILIP